MNLNNIKIIENQCIPDDDDDDDCRNWSYNKKIDIVIILVALIVLVF